MAYIIETTRKSDHIEYSYDYDTLLLCKKHILANPNQHLTIIK